MRITNCTRLYKSNNRKKQKERRENKEEDRSFSRELLFKEDGQEYAQVLRSLGDGRFDLKCMDNFSRMGRIRGTMRLKTWINTGDIVLVSYRCDHKVDIIHKYTFEEVCSLKSYAEIPYHIKLGESFLFDDEESDEEHHADFDFSEI